MTIVNLPALLMCDQINQLKSVVSQSLENDFIPEGESFASLRDDWEQVDKANKERAETAISMLFDGRPIAAFLGVDFWVYALSLQEVDAIKEKARAYGFKRLETFVPKAGHPDDEMISIADPCGSYAVRVGYSRDLIFGKHAKKWLSFYEQPISTVQEYITYTYCYNNDASFDFNDEQSAKIMHCGLLAHYRDLKKAAINCGKEAPAVNIVIGMKKGTLDVWTVSLSLGV